MLYSFFHTIPVKKDMEWFEMTSDFDVLRRKSEFHKNNEEKNTKKKLFYAGILWQKKSSVRPFFSIFETARDI